MNTIDLAIEAAQWIESVARDGKPDDFYYRVKKDAPEWIKELCKAAHMSDGSLMLPDDFRYEFVSKALDMIAESETEEDAEDRAREFEPDVYNHERLAWLGSHPCRAGFVDEAIEEFGPSKWPGIIEMIGWGQVREFYEVFDSVMSFLRDRAEAENEADSDRSHSMACPSRHGGECLCGKFEEDVEKGR